ncbi:MAG: hypothetical protein AB1657_04810 [Candidatus Micrarchaeota archaeon]
MDIKLILLGLFAFFGLAVFLIILFFLWRRFSSLVKFEKTAYEGKSRVFLQTFIPIKRAVIEDVVGEEPIVFVKEDLKPGDRVEFFYPLSQGPVKLTVEGEENFTLEQHLKAG